MKIRRAKTDFDKVGGEAVASISKFTALSTIMLLIIFPWMVANTSTYAVGLDTDFEAFFDQQILAQMEEHRIAGITLAVVANGEVVLSKGYGYADLERQVPVDPKGSLFRIGSTSKLFTWVAVMQLVEQGKLDLDTDVNDYLDFAIPSQLHNNSSIELPPITLRHLITHTPGFEDVVDGLFYIDAAKAPSIDQYLRAYLPARVFPPGELMAYSNYGTALAGYIVERVSGKSFEGYVEENIYAPLGMDNSSFRQPLSDQLSPNMIRAYRYVDGEYLQGSFEFMPAAAGGMSSSAEDMAKFMLAQLQGGAHADGRILAVETMQQMHQQQFTHHPSLGGVTLGLMEGHFNGRRVLSHGGGTMLFSIGLYMLPEESIGIFISYSGGAHLIHAEIFQAFMDHHFPAERTPQLVPREGSRERSRAFAGEYLPNRRSFTNSSSIISLMQGIQVQVDKEGYLSATFLGETNRFVEVEPGVYLNLREGRTQDYYGPFSRLVFTTDSFGNALLTSDGPMTYSKAPWYGGAAFTLLSLGSSVVLIIGSLFYWLIRFVIALCKRRGTTHPKLAVTARLAAITFALLTLVFVASLAANGQVHPVYGLPAEAFGEVAEAAGAMDSIALLMAILGVAVIVFTLLAWLKGFWRPSARVHYTIFATATVLLIWLFNYWHLI